MTATLVVELLAFAAFMVGWEFTGSHPAGARQFGLLALAALAMGLQSAGMRNVATTLSTTYLTGTLASAVASLVTRSQSSQRNRLNVAVLVAVAGGGTAGGALLADLPATFPLLPIGALTGVIAELLRCAELGQLRSLIVVGQIRSP